ncbi:MAG TPA: serine/threonine-protein kinase [Polyangiaceae bacterium]
MADRARADTFEEETRRLLQQRLKLTFSVLAGVSLFYVLSDVTQMLLSAETRQSPTQVTLLTFVLGTVMALLAWRCRGALRSSRELSGLDAGAMTLIGWVMAVSMTQVTPPSEGAASLVLGATYVFMARAVLLPSSGRRTAWLGVVALLPAGLVATWLRVEAFAPAGRPDDWLIQGWLAIRNLGMTIFLAALTSRVIYGLRRQVQENAQIGQYRLREKIGQGGMGAVYRATHALLRRDTALKVLLPDRVGTGSSRFEREVKLTAQLTHQNTVAIFDYGRTPDGVFYYAMEYLEGGDLERLVEYAGPLPPARAVHILEQLCRALAEAHGLGLIHRDIKPSNVILCERGREGDIAKICDFGLVKDLNATSDAALTQDNALTGTPLYLAPESIKTPESVGARADLYSLGALAHFLLTGEPVFDGKSVVEVCAAHLHEAAPAPSSRRPGLPIELDAIVLRCLEKKPEARFAGALELRAALLACNVGETWDGARAEAWWAEHREAFRQHCAARRTEAAGTGSPAGGGARGALRVDFREREAASFD